MNITRITLTFFLILTTLSLQGCLGHRMYTAIQAGQPLPQWEKHLVKKYTALVDDEGLGEPGTLRFISEYETKYPQLSGIPEDAFLQKGKAAFDDLQYEHYAAYRRNRLVSELESEKTLLDIEGKRARLLALQATLKLEQAKLDVLIAAANTQEAKEEPLSGSIAEIQKSVSDLRNNVATLKTQITTAEKKVLARKIQRVKNLDNKTNHLQAAGILEMAKIERNRIISDLMIVAKRVHDMKDNYLHYTRASVNTLFDFVQIISSGVGAVAGSEETVRALSATAAGAAATQESVDTRYFYQHATSAVLAIMRKQRHAAEQVVVANMTKEVIEYPLRVALTDYVDFLLAGGLTDALTELGADAKVKELRELEKLNELKKMRGENLERLQEEAGLEAAKEAKREAWRRKYFDLADQELLERIEGLLE